MAKVQSDPVIALEKNLGALREKRGQLASRRETAAKALSSAHFARREALLAGSANDSSASSRAVVETGAQVAGLEDAIASLDQQIGDAERSLAEARETRQRAEEATNKRQLADAIEREYQSLLAAAEPLIALLDQLSPFSMGPGLAEVLRMTQREFAMGLPPTLNELRNHAALLADQNITSKTLRANGVWPHLPGEPSPPPKDDGRAHLRWMDPTVDIANTGFDPGKPPDWTKNLPKDPRDPEHRPKFPPSIAEAAKAFPEIIGPPRKATVSVGKRP
jgi:hypothetical protein